MNAAIQNLGESLFVSFGLIFYIFTSVYLDYSLLTSDHHPVHPPHKSLVHIHVFFSNYNNYLKFSFLIRRRNSTTATNY